MRMVLVALIAAISTVDIAAEEVSVYTFVSDQSVIHQTGGFAGVDWTYTLEGRFQLSVDPNAGTAVFTAVDANAVRTDDPSQTLDPNEVFNLTGLTGMLTLSGAYVFRGHVADGSSVVITIAFEDDSASLIAQTTPPPNSADFFVFTLDAAATRKYGGGTGEPNDPYQIWTVDHLLAMNADPCELSGHFKLMADIDLNAYHVDRSFLIWRCFLGVFDGNGHVIANLGYPLFNQIGDISQDIGAVTNLGIVDPNISILPYTMPGAGSLACHLWGSVDRCYVRGGQVYGDSAAGGMIGICHGGTTITDCWVDTYVSGDCCVGGLVGHHVGQYSLELGKIISCSAAGTVVGRETVGGLIGSNSGTVLDSFATCSVSGTNVVGGLVGWNTSGRSGRGRIVDCYSAGPVFGDPNTGGLIGAGGGETLNSFWDIETSGQVTSAGGEGKTTAEMQTAGTFLNAGWDFVGESENGPSDVWKIAEGLDYPRLAWEPYDGQVTVELGQAFPVTLESNPSTGYRWEWIEDPNAIVEQVGQTEFIPRETDDPFIVGAGGWEVFTFQAIRSGQMTLGLVYRRPWEEGVEPLRTFLLQVTVP